MKCQKMSNLNVTNGFYTSEKKMKKDVKSDATLGKVTIR